MWLWTSSFFSKNSKSANSRRCPRYSLNFTWVPNAGFLSWFCKGCHAADGSSRLKGVSENAQERNVPLKQVKIPTGKGSKKKMRRVGWRQEAGRREGERRHIKESILCGKKALVKYLSGIFQGRKGERRWDSSPWGNLRHHEVPHPCQSLWLCGSS